VVVVTATQEPEAAAFEPGTGSLAEPSRLLAEAAAELAGHGVQVSTRIETSEPAEALAVVARHVGAALIVVGARGDRYLARALRGSVGEKLIARAPCDLLIAR
jgi:nucleotide-binding universal stress UspA family protein